MAEISSFVQLHTELARRLSDAQFDHDRPHNPKGSHWLDVRKNDKHVAIEWRQSTGFGVSLVTAQSGYGEGADHVFTEAELPKAVDKVVELIT